MYLLSTPGRASAVTAATGIALPYAHTDQSGTVQFAYSDPLITTPARATVTAAGGVLWDDQIDGSPRCTATVQLAALMAAGSPARQAIAANDAFLATVAGRRTNIATGKTAATSLSTATVTSLTKAQSGIRQAGALLAEVATALDDLNNQAETVTKEASAVIRLLLGQLDSVSGT